MPRRFGLPLLPPFGSVTVWMVGRPTSHAPGSASPASKATCSLGPELSLSLPPLAGWPTNQPREPIPPVSGGGRGAPLPPFYKFAVKTQKHALGTQKHAPRQFPCALRPKNSCSSVLHHHRHRTRRVPPVPASVPSHASHFCTMRGAGGKDVVPCLDPAQCCCATPALIFASLHFCVSAAQTRCQAVRIASEPTLQAWLLPTLLRMQATVLQTMQKWCQQKWCQ